MDDERLKITVLFDFYGEILSNSQRDYIDLYYNSDLSLSEIGELRGVTRQGVHDVLSRARNALFNAEEKLGLAARCEALASAVEYLNRLRELNASRYRDGDIEETLNLITDALEI